MAGNGTAHLRGADALLRVEDLVVEYRTSSGIVHAVSGVSFDVLPGETLGIVGESGCGKSSTGRAVLRLDRITGGQVTFDGEPIHRARPRRLRLLRKRMQMIFQDPVASLNPRRRVRDLVVEGLAVAGRPKAERVETAERVLREVALSPERYADLLPRQLSGGQAQRVAIARALAMRPRLLICDEPVASLDVSVQAQILNLIQDLKDEFELTVIVIAHDLGVVRAISDRVLIMYLGRVCEFGDPETVYANPAHPYTRALLDSVPSADPAHPFSGPALGGDLPSPLAPPSGCPFRGRCPKAQQVCAEHEPELAEAPTGQFVACHFPAEHNSDHATEDSVATTV